MKSKLNVHPEIEAVLQNGFTDSRTGITYPKEIVKMFIDEAIERHNERKYQGPFTKHKELVHDLGMYRATYLASSNTPGWVVDDNNERPDAGPVNVTDFIQSNHLLGSSFAGLQIQIRTFVRKEDGCHVMAITRKDPIKIYHQQGLRRG